MEIQKYPLLVAGFYADASGTNETFTAIGAGVRKSWNNTIITGRGDMVMIDVMPTMKAVPVADEAVINVSVGGMTVINNASLTEYAHTAAPRSNEILKLKQSGGQTLQFSAVGSTGNDQGAAVHIYHENKFATPEIIAARHYSSLKQRIIDFNTTLATGNKYVASNTFVVPSNVGNVVGIQLMVFDDTAGTVVSQCLVGLSIGGVSIFQDVAGGLFQYNTARPGLIWPILIRGTETFQVVANTGNAAAGSSIIIKIRLYLDDDVTGTRQYKTL